ncbi:MAG: hypothetical protein CME71_08300 [Halobacteriovorax sp.]|nr:hypothetical protein [Halobacteriovorax sp.]
MKYQVVTIAFAALLTIYTVRSQEATPSKELEPYKPDINLAKIDRIDQSSEYLEKLSKAFGELKQDFQKSQALNKDLKTKIEELEAKLKNNNSTEIKLLSERIDKLEAKITPHDFEQNQKDYQELKKSHETLEKDYANAKAMLEQIKLLIAADYDSRLSKSGTSDNKLKGILEEINKIQLIKAKATPTPTPTPTVTPTATPTPSVSATSTPKPTTEAESFLEKYPLPARQTFCRKPENLKKFQTECLPYL